MRYVFLALVMLWVGNHFLSLPSLAEAPPGTAAEHALPPHGPTHLDPILLGVIVILVAAKIGGELAHRINQPPVLGELLSGILLGNAYLFAGTNYFNYIQEELFLQYLAGFGAIILLCRVGIETDLVAMLEAGLSAFMVAVGGVVAPAVLGFFLCSYFFPEMNPYARLVVITALCATSVGITVRVFEDLGKLQTQEARIVVGAAIIDDVLGLLILSVVASVITTGSMSFGGVAKTAVYALLFFLAAGLVSFRLSAVLGDYISRLRAEGMKLLLSVLICFTLAYTADRIGLAPIVGAFAAGLILKGIKVKDFQGHEHMMDEMIRPAYLVFVPIFFVLMGAQVRLESFLDRTAVELAVGITGVAILGKLFCGLCVLGKGLNRSVIAVAMIPRGEVAIIFASMGKGMGVLSDSLYSAIVIMSMFTTLVTPPLLKWLVYKPEEFELYEKEAKRYEI